MTDITIDLQQIILLSQAMLNKAKNESWDDVFILEKDRLELLNIFLSTAIKPEYEKEVTVAIQALLAMDKEIMTLGQLKKLDFTRMLQTMGQGKKAVKAYTS